MEEFSKEFESQFNLEEGLTDVLDITLHAMSIVRPDIPEAVFRSKIAATNLRSLAHVLLLADDPNSGVGANLKQLILGLLTTAEWLEPSDEAFDAQ